MIARDEVLQTRIQTSMNAVVLVCSTCLRQLMKLFPAILSLDNSHFQQLLPAATPTAHQLCSQQIAIPELDHYHTLNSCHCVCFAAQPASSMPHDGWWAYKDVIEGSFIPGKNASLLPDFIPITAS